MTTREYKSLRSKEFSGTPEFAMQFVSKMAQFVASQESSPAIEETAFEPLGDDDGVTPG